MQIYHRCYHRSADGGKPRYGTRVCQCMCAQWSPPSPWTGGSCPTQCGNPASEITQTRTVECSFGHSKKKNTQCDRRTKPALSRVMQCPATGSCQCSQTTVNTANLFGNNYLGMVAGHRTCGGDCDDIKSNAQYCSMESTGSSGQESRGQCTGYRITGGDNNNPGPTWSDNYEYRGQPAGFQAGKCFCDCVGGQWANCRSNCWTTKAAVQAATQHGGE